MTNERIAKLVASRSGFVAAIDQSGGSTRNALLHYGVDDATASDPEHMFDAMHLMRSRIIRSPAFADGAIFGAILFEKTMDGMIDTVRVPTCLARIDVLAFLKIDHGLEPERDGVRVMARIPDLPETLGRATTLGVIGTKARSVIAKPSATGIKAIVAQQFELAQIVSEHGLLPILEPEVVLDAEDRARCEDLLHDALVEWLDKSNDNVMLKLSLPFRSGRYHELAEHPRVSKLLALSGGYSRIAACAYLRHNHGMTASFSRALIQDLRLTMTPAEFDANLREAIDEVYRASTTKVGSDYADR